MSRKICNWSLIYWIFFRFLLILRVSTTTKSKVSSDVYFLWFFFFFIFTRLCWLINSREKRIKFCFISVRTFCSFLKAVRQSTSYISIGDYGSDINVGKYSPLYYRTKYAECSDRLGYWISADYLSFKTLILLYWIPEFIGYFISSKYQGYIVEYQSWNLNPFFDTLSLKRIFFSHFINLFAMFIMINKRVNNITIIRRGSST